MKKIISILLLFLFYFNYNYCLANLKLPEPNYEDSFLKILLNRKSSRDFSGNKSISDEHLSNILWSAYGVNRKEDNKRVIPTARNVQDLKIFVIKKNGTFSYNAISNTLENVTNKNLFKYFSKSQQFVEKADIILLYTSTNDKDWSKLHAGSAYQNVANYCAEHNIKNLIKGMYDEDGLAKELNIDDDNIIISQILGY